MKKLIQLKLYSFLSSKWGILVLLIGLFITFNSALQLFQTLVNSDGTSVPLPTPVCPYGKIDVVYTWVNGTDPRQKKALNEVKKKLLGEDFEVRVCNTTENKTCIKDEESDSRFVDNEEFRYSLRSIEKHAKWVNHIYLVTNGQVPYWLNLDHPRLTVVTHEQIFLNKSHLPTFSSPSIECHIHRIPGLSEKFIYMNDDVFFGREVWPDDFYSQSSGQKVFLSWPVPNCNDGCPASWIGDGYCDVACNVSACKFDAGDCANVTANSGNSWWANYNSGRNSEAYKHYCSKGCPDSWIGDKYCDKPCNNHACGFDAGDCGVGDIYGEMYGVDLSENVTSLELPAGEIAVYFNLSRIVGEGTIVDGSHDNAKLVRTATISQKNKLMTLTFHYGKPADMVAISIMTSLDGNNVEKTFNVSVQATPNNTANAPASPPANAASNSTDQNQPSAPITPESSSTPSAPSTPSTVDAAAPSSDNGNQATPPPSQQEPATDGDSATDAVNPLLRSKVKEQIFSRRTQGKFPRSFTTSRQPLSFDDVTNTTNTNTITTTIIDDVEDPPSTLSLSEKIDKLSERLTTTIDGMKDGITKFLVSEALTQYLDELPFALPLPTGWQGQQMDDLAIKKWINNIKDKWVQYQKPVEKPVVQEYKDHYPSLSEVLAEKGMSLTAGGSRKLLDMYGDSLRYVNSLYNDEFGVSARQVPAHMPHLIDKNLMDQLQERFSRQFEETSSHQLRSATDMQYAFSYFYFLMHQTVPYDQERVFREELDTDGDGFINDNELRTVAVYYYGLPLALDAVPKLKTLIHTPWVNTSGQNTTNANSTQSVEAPSTPPPPPIPEDPRGISYEVLFQNHEVASKLQKHFSKKLKNKFETFGTEDVAFFMVGTNATNVLKSLDDIRLKRQKFCCLNDNINHTNPDAAKVVKELHAFYEAMFPKPSSFELPPNKPNKFLYIDEYQLHKTRENYGTAMKLVGVVILMIVAMCLILRRQKRKTKVLKL